ncbi:hypothetical protein [Methylococcus sp. EFPC2]|uniref:hypothetical protein n=1 Tax=Methylococcus sp. EFPC2 TaxID=2812648 RepID=UPI001966EBDE|nr:hypothetical protein [Methylococcus sp. EFPC2]QSA98336.1 hypothetical protein JWZ97_05870 [Methylococcus sp. EFPC2]
MQHKHDDIPAALELARRGAILGDPYVAAPRRRGRALALFFFVALLVLSVYLFLHTHQFFDRTTAKLEQGDGARIGQYSRQIAALEEKMSVFIADSVEDRLRTLERNVAEGKVGEQEIRGIEALKSEVKLLETYAAGKGGNIIDPARLDHPRLQPVPGSPPTARYDQMLDELMRLKQLLYLSIASSGTVGLFLGGYWWRNTLRVRSLQAAPDTKLLRGPDSAS